MDNNNPNISDSTSRLMAEISRNDSSLIAAIYKPPPNYELYTTESNIIVDISSRPSDYKLGTSDLSEIDKQYMSYPLDTYSSDTSKKITSLNWNEIAPIVKDDDDYIDIMEVNMKESRKNETNQLIDSKNLLSSGSKSYKSFSFKERYDII